MDISKIATNIIRSVSTGQLCRLWSVELSSIKPQLDAHNVALVGVGLEELGLQEFQDGKFFSGDLYIDGEKKCYKDLGFKRYNALSVMGGLIAKETRESLSKSNAKGIKGNMKGDGMQNGGMLIVSLEGNVLFSHSQTSPGDHVSNATILQALGIKDGGEGAEKSLAGDDEASGGTKMECNEDVCAIPSKK